MKTGEPTTFTCINFGLSLSILMITGTLACAGEGNGIPEAIFLLVLCWFLGYLCGDKYGTKKREEEV